MPDMPDDSSTAGAAPFRIGEVVAGHYEVRQPLGSGAMGQVFEAHDRLLNRRVALKVLLPTAEPQLLRREGQALAAIRHPSVVSIYAMARHGGQELLVMERVFGVSLESMLDQRRRRGEAMTVGEAFDLLAPIADGLSAVHAAGLAHRDVTPSNVMLAPSGRVVLMDFGLMLPVADEPRAHATDALAGSLAYMAPEALRGNVAPGRAPLLDVYSLGVIAYRMLTGIAPYDGEDARAVLSAMRAGVPRASAHHRGIAEPVDDFVRALMAHDPAERPQSAESVVWQLRKLRDHHAQESVRPSGSPVSVLIVDDDPRAIDTFRLFVHAAASDAELFVARSGEEALRIVRNRIPTLMILALGLPDMNGAEVVMYLRGMRAGHRCTIIASEPPASPGDQQLLAQLGVRFVPRGEDRLAAIARLLENLPRA